MRIVPDGDNHKECGHLDAAARANGGGDKIKDSAGGENREVESREIVVQEQLPLHKEEGEVVQRPAHHKEANEVVIFHRCGWRAMSKVYSNQKHKGAHCGESPYSHVEHGG